MCLARQALSFADLIDDDLEHFHIDLAAALQQLPSANTLHFPYGTVTTPFSTQQEYNALLYARTHMSKR